MEAKKLTFTHVQPYFRDESGDIYLLTTDEQIQEMKVAIAHLEKEIEQVKKDPERDQKSNLLARLEADRRVTQEGLDTAIQIRSRLEGKLASWQFVLRRYSWNEKKQAQDSATTVGPDLVPVVNWTDMILKLLFTSLESWNVKRGDLFTCDGRDANEVLEITTENIANLPPRLVEALYAKLYEKSEPSEAKLRFLA